MDEERNDLDMLPGFRFHPTDEELVGFYLRRKIQHRSLPIELIKQLDIYKFDPWDLPKFASSGEKEWYFYCPRDRKYRNSARPNRVTGAGFWKATGTDRPIYSSEGSKCIGLKKSLVFYRGRAAKGIKTDWMMHEFRLPSLAEPGPPKKLLDKSYPANDAWAICRIFKKTNSMAQRALSQSWFSSLPETTPASDHMLTNQPLHGPQFSSENISCTTDIGSAIQHNSTTSFFAPDHIPSYKPHNQKPCLYPVPNRDLPFMFSPLEMSGTAATMMLNQQSVMGDISISFDGSQEQFSGFSISLAKEMQGNSGTGEQQEDGLRNDPSAPHSQVNSQWRTTSTIGSIGFPFSLPWDSPPCPSEMSTNKCYS